MTPSTRARLLRWTGFGTLAGVALLRATTEASRLPHWDVNPAAGLPEATLTPALGLLLDALALAAAGAILAGETLARRPIRWGTGALLLIGGVGVLLHGLVLEPWAAAGGTPRTFGDGRSLETGSAWLAAIVGTWAALHALRDRRLWTATAGLLAGAACLLALKGIHQVLVELPATLADFEARRGELLRSQGIEPGSPAAAIFERRLTGGDATGWFGLGNVYGGVLGALLVLGAGMTLEAGRRLRRAGRQLGPAGIVGAAAVAGAIGLALSQSRGGAAAALAGAGLLLAIALRPKLLAGAARWTRLALVVVPAAAVGLVVLRGVLGDALDERSLLFRWHYLVGAGRIAIDHPILGVGPGGFKSAYAVAKVPTSPESIDSPHAIAAEWIATLGVLGLAWLVAAVYWILRPGPAAAEDDGAADHGGGPVDLGGLRFLGIFVVAVSTASIAVAWPVASLQPSAIALRAFGAVCWLVVAGVAATLCRGDAPLARAGAVGGALVLLSSGQIEMTLARPDSAPLCGLLVALGLAALPSRSSATRAGPARAPGVAAAGAAVLLAGLLGVLGALPAQRWEAHLANGAQAMRGPTPRLDHAAEALGDAAATRPSIPGPAQRRLGLLVATGRVEAAAALAHDLSERWPRSSGVQVGAARVLLILADAAGPASAERARLAADRAVAAAPHDLTPALLRFEVYRTAGPEPEAVAAARRLLAVDDALALDPLARLPEPRRREVEAWLAARSAGPDEARRRSGGDRSAGES